MMLWNILGDVDETPVMERRREGVGGGFGALGGVVLGQARRDH